MVHVVRRAALARGSSRVALRQVGNTRTLSEIGKHASWHPEHSHLVAQGYGAKPLRQRSRKGRAGNRDGEQRSAHRRSRWKSGAVFPFPGPPDSAAASFLFRQSEYRDLFDPYRLAQFTMHKPEQEINSVMS